MTTLLVINSSVQGNNSESRRLVNYYLEQWCLLFPDSEIIFRDIGRDPIPHLTEETVSAISSMEGDSPEIVSARGFSDNLIEEVQRADRIILGVPMYNFAIPSQLKSYFDYIARSGLTFTYNSQGEMVGLLTNKPVLIITTGAGDYLETSKDFQKDYLIWMFKFLGISNVTFIRAHNLYRQRELSVSRAKNEIDRYLNATYYFDSIINSEIKSPLEGVDNQLQHIRKLQEYKSPHEVKIQTSAALSKYSRSPILSTIKVLSHAFIAQPLGEIAALGIISIYLVKSCLQSFRNYRLPPEKQAKLVTGISFQMKISELNELANKIGRLYNSQPSLKDNFQWIEFALYEYKQSIQEWQAQGFVYKKELHCLFMDMRDTELELISKLNLKKVISGSSGFLVSQSRKSSDLLTKTVKNYKYSA